MKTRQTIRILVAALIISGSVAIAPVGFTGCKQLPTTSVNEDAVVNAEKTLRISKDTFDIFLKLEKQNQALIKAKSPQVHQFAEYIRVNAPYWLVLGNDLKNQYKHGTGSLQALLSILDVLKQNTSQSQTYINQINAH